MSEQLRKKALQVISKRRVSIEKYIRENPDKLNTQTTKDLIDEIEILEMYVEKTDKVFTAKEQRYNDLIKQKDDAIFELNEEKQELDNVIKDLIFQMNQIFLWMQMHYGQQTFVNFCVDFQKDAGVGIIRDCVEAEFQKEKALRSLFEYVSRKGDTISKLEEANARYLGIYKQIEKERYQDGR